MVHKRDAKDWAREHVKGLWTSPMIPFKEEDLSIDEAGIRHNVERMIAVKSHGIGFGFSEPWVCTIEERKRAMEVSVDAIRKRVPNYLHTTDHSVVETIGLVKHAEASGTDAVMIWAPYEWAKSEEMICEFYEYVASKVDIAIFAYNTYHSGIRLSPESLKRIAKIPNVCALKNAVNDIGHTVRCFELFGDEIVVSNANEEHLTIMMHYFNQQVLLGTTAVYMLQSPTYQPIYQYYQYLLKGDMANATKLFYEVQPLRDIRHDLMQVLWDKKAAMHPIAVLKFWMDLIGMVGGPVRPPMKSMSKQEKTVLQARVDASGYLNVLFPKQAAAE